jgi:hypothetical protein
MHPLRFPPRRRPQVNRTKRGISLKELPEWLTAIGTIALGVFALMAWRESIEGTKVLQNQLDAALAAQRPWVTAAVSLNHEPIKTMGDSYDVPISVKLTNIGHNPAARVTALVKLVNLGPGAGSRLPTTA